MKLKSVKFVVMDINLFVNMMINKKKSQDLQRRKCFFQIGGGNS